MNPSSPARFDDGEAFGGSSKTLTAIGGSNGYATYIFKVNAAGAVLWAEQIGTTASYANAIAMDPTTGIVFLAGNFGTADSVTLYDGSTARDGALRFWCRCDPTIRSARLEEA